MKETESKRLILRNWKESDYQDLFEYAKSDLVGPQAGWPPHQNEEESKYILQKFIQDDDVLAIELKGENKIIGSIGLHQRCPDKTIKTEKQKEIGYVLNPSYWGKGYVPEAVEAVLEMGFHELGQEIIWCGHFEDNPQSRRVIEKSGFQYRFKQEETKHLLGNKKVVVWYYMHSPESFRSWKNQ